MRLIDADILLANYANDVVLANGAKHRCIDATIICEVPTVDAVLRDEYESLLRRFRHLISSDYIRSFDEWNKRTNTYKRDIKKADDVIPIMHGEWIEKQIKTVSHTRACFCSKCGWLLDSLEKTTFCPNCGAKMNAEVEG